MLYTCVELTEVEECTINYREVAKANINDRVSWVCVAIGEQKLKVSGLYKPPSYDNNEFLLVLKSLFVKHQKRHIIVGDFNINLLENTNVVVNYKNLVSVNNFEIKNDISEEAATRISANTISLIDHVLCDRHSSINCLVKVDTNSLSDHNILSVQVDQHIKVYKPKVAFDCIH